jgi:hypothetical protein
MGLLTRLLTLPLEPVRGVAWVGEQLLSAAELDYYDEARIRRQLLELEEDLEAGRISAEEYDAAEEELIDRLLEAQQRGQPVRFDTPDDTPKTPARRPSRRDRSQERQARRS